jgi:hypothetical protein
MDGMFETCHLAGYKKTQTPPSIGFKVQRFPAALQSDSLPPGVDKFCRTFSAWSHVAAMLYAQFIQINCDQ